MNKPDNHIGVLDILIKVAGVYMDEASYKLLVTDEGREPTLSFDEAAKLIDQYYADFYRNKILEAIKEELKSFTGHSNEVPEHVISARIKELGDA